MSLITLGSVKCGHLLLLKSLYMNMSRSLSTVLTLLIHKIQYVDGNDDSASVDILNWYNFIALDIVNDLIWSTSFGCLDQDRYPSWLQIIDQFKVTMIRVAFRYYPPANFILNLITPKAAFAPITRVWRDIEERL